MTHRRKGANGELEVVALMQEWWRRLEPETRLRRTPSSGAWSRDPAFQAKGDIIVARETCLRWPWSVEVKFRKRCTVQAIRHFTQGDQSPIWDWWDQCCRAAEHDKLRPLLWFRGNRMNWWVAFEEAGQVWLFREADFLKLPPSYFALP